MTAVSTNPADAVVYITSLISAATSTSPAIGEQGSGVLIAPDEVLTAAHVVYNAQGQLYSNTLVSPGYQGQVLYGSAAERSVHAMPFADWTQLSGTQGDFALIHLATPITNVPIMALGSNFTGGAVTVTGYPAASSGQQASLQETVSQVAGYGVLQGTPLAGTGDSHGASGGPVWETVDGVPTVVGLTSSENGATGYFLQLTAADVAQIQSWMAADHASTSTAGQQQASSTADAARVTGAVSAAGGGMSMLSNMADPAMKTNVADAIADLSNDAAHIGFIAAHGAIDHATSRVVALLTQDAAALGRSASFNDVASDVLSQLGDNSQSRNLAASLLEGLVWGHDGGHAAGTIGAVTAQDPGIAAYHGSVQSARAGYLLGHALQAHGF